MDLILDNMVDTVDKSDACTESVLVIDDKFGPRESLRMLFKYDYEVYCAESVNEGVEIFETKRPNLVILDINMPEKDGIKGLAEIRAIDPDAAVIMLTGYGTLSTAQQALRLGAADYITKPFDANDMRKLVRKHLARADLIRRRNAAEEKLRELTTQLSAERTRLEKDAEMGQASVEFAHDLRNSLTSIRGYVSFLVSRLNETHNLSGNQLFDTLDKLSDVENSVMRCCDIIELWKNLTPHKHMRRELFSLSDLLKSMVAEFQSGWANGTAKCVFKTDINPAEIIGDDTQLYRALRNIVDNAVHSVQDCNGVVYIECGVFGPNVEIRIIDNGCGISKADLEQIFDPYFTTKSPDIGTGLGLFITKKIIAKHSGVIAVETERGRGTTFSIRFPVPLDDI